MEKQKIENLLEKVTPSPYIGEIEISNNLKTKEELSIYRIMPKHVTY